VNNIAFKKIFNFKINYDFKVNAPYILNFFTCFLTGILESESSGVEKRTVSKQILRKEYIKVQTRLNWFR
jgi:hypothetical protein